jgi:hypothetical protein
LRRVVRLLVAWGFRPHQVAAVTPQYRAAATTRYTFKDWDGSVANPITVTKPAAGNRTATSPRTSRRSIS